ncbi:MAG: RNA-binding transcriptional accessory protein [bacterium]|nr:RNA-binding transcriptional accessory protein [bacterium]
MKSASSQTEMDVGAATEKIAAELGLQALRVRAAVQLLTAGNTVPFIARYRKEATRGLDEVALRAIEDAWEQEQTLVARKATVLQTIEELGALTHELRSQIEACSDLRTLEAIYLPFKPKRRTRASIARERGLQPLANLLLLQQSLGEPKTVVLQRFVNADLEVPDGESALQGALDIVAEQWSDDSDTRTWLHEHALRHGQIQSQVKRGKKQEADKYEAYLQHQEPLRKIPSHRLLAMLRGEAEGVLKLSVLLDDPQALSHLKQKLIHNRDFEFHRELLSTVEDCYQRLLQPAVRSSVLQFHKEKADEEAIQVFARNLRELLLAPPAGPRVTMGIDPGFRTGCKVAVVDGTGKFLAHCTIYPTPPKNDVDAARHILLGMIKKHRVELIAIGNGTASRETDAFVGDLIREHQLSVAKVMVSESGASIYSASELAGKEFPDLDVTVRGAISIARRLQDPLAELVKTDPKSIGVGQYQHDVNQTKLRKCLERVVESCVNHVGVDLNMASVSLLSHVAGIGPALAKNIVDYRDRQGSFTNRDQLNRVPKLGKKAYEQAAGFLRIRNGDVPLDNSAVHPECYEIVNRMARKLGTDPKSLVGNAALSQKLKPEEFVDERFGMPTIQDIISELAKPGRDPRSEFRVVQFDSRVNGIQDLKPGMILEGVITNVTHFGAFVDIGVHQDALVHISQLAHQFVHDPNEVVAVGDVVKVKVLEIDAPRKRISLTRKF